MKVREWIEWLSNQPAENEVVLRDPDTDWYLVLKTAPIFPSDDAPPATTAVFADYYEIGEHRG